MMLSQAAEYQNWEKYGAFGIVGLLMIFGIPWLLKHLREVNEKHSATIEKVSAEHTDRVEKLIADHAHERQIHCANMDRVCATFKEEMQAERAACERRVEMIVKAR